MLIDLTDKVVVITGSSRGLGARLALEFAKEQAKVVINYNKSANDAQVLYEKIKKFNNNCLLVHADVTKLYDVQKLYKKTIEKYGKIDILINNAGICEDGFVHEMKKCQWDRVIETNLTGTFLCSSVFVKKMIEQRFGKIINIVSIKGQKGSKRQANYAASKAGIIALTMTMAQELGEYNISVNAVAPGFISTDLNINNVSKRENAQKSSYLPIDYSMEDFWASILYLASNSVRGVTGRVFNIDSRI